MTFKFPIGLSLAVFASAVFLFVFWGQLINHDTAWYLIATRQWLEGAQLYTDIIEVNPPLNFYYTLPAIGLADLIGISDINAQYSVIAVLYGVSLFWVWSILSAKPFLPLMQRSLLLLTIAFALIIPALNNIGQREQIMCLFLLPWVMRLIVLPEEGGGVGGVLAGIFAALGICLKPFFLVFPLFITISEMIRQRSFRPAVSPANLGMLGIGLTYVGLAVILHPEYFTETIPLARLVYGDYGYSAPAILASLRLPLLVLVFTLLLLDHISDKRSPSFGIFLALILSGMASYFIQWTGYSYHRVPLYIWGLVYAGWTCFNNGAGMIMRFASIGVGIVISIASLRGGMYKNSIAEGLSVAISDIKPSPKVVVYTPHVNIGPIIALEANGTWASHYPALWSVPAIANRVENDVCTVAADHCKLLEKERATTRQNILDDLQKWQADVIIFDTKPDYINNPTFSFKAFLMENEQIAQEFSHYKYSSHYGRFEIWSRQN